MQKAWRTAFGLSPESKKFSHTS
ncbi:hypothetical protein Goklo_008196 [Gossypium klotzschianum]|uniref:Uncharacterized protein n=1 Tax=Gossypium klotzschianum TaxID=34286 RepID=A0A7J8UZD5_9ROSI|nr:hypothetical protein [Gossypium klotzschianum]